MSHYDLIAKLVNEINEAMSIIFNMELVKNVGFFTIRKNKVVVSIPVLECLEEGDSVTNNVLVFLRSVEYDSPLDAIKSLLSKLKDIYNHMDTIRNYRLSLAKSIDEYSYIVTNLVDAKNEKS